MPGLMLPPQVMGIEAAAFHTTMALGHWSKVARIKEAGLWRGQPGSPHYGHGNDAENFLALDLVMPQACAPSPHHFHVPCHLDTRRC